MANHCCHPKNKTDYLLWGSLTAIVLLCVHQWLFPSATIMPAWYRTLATSVFDLVNTMWWGVTLGILMLSVLTRVPREFVMSILGTKGGFGGLLRARAARLLLDLCSHGILMVGAKLYERGAGIGQVIAFLVASPWNSFSLSVVLIALIAGYIFDILVSQGLLPGNQNQNDLPEDFRFWRENQTGPSEY